MNNPLRDPIALKQNIIITEFFTHIELLRKQGMAIDYLLHNLFYVMVCSIICPLIKNSSNDFATSGNTLFPSNFFTGKGKPSAIKFF